MSNSYVRFTEAERQRLRNEGYSYLLVMGIKNIALLDVQEQICMLITPLSDWDRPSFAGKWIEEIDSQETDHMIRYADQLPVFLLIPDSPERL